MCSCDGDTMQDELYSIHQSSARLLFWHCSWGLVSVFLSCPFFVIVKLKKNTMPVHVTEGL